MKNKIIYTILILSVALNIGLIYKFFFQGEKAVLANDGRTEIKMKKENREFVMTEMRSFLESVQKINEGVAKNDPKIIEKIGQESGSCKIDAVPQGLVKSLPFGFNLSVPNGSDKSSTITNKSSRAIFSFCIQ